MKRDGGGSSIEMTELLVRTSLANFVEAERFQCPDHLEGFQNWDARTQAALTLRVPTNSEVNSGSPSSSNMAKTSAMFS